MSTICVYLSHKNTNPDDESNVYSEDEVSFNDYLCHFNGNYLTIAVYNASNMWKNLTCNDIIIGYGPQRVVLD